MGYIHYRRLVHYNSHILSYDTFPCPTIFRGNKIIDLARFHTGLLLRESSHVIQTKTLGDPDFRTAKMRLSPLYPS